MALLSLGDFGLEVECTTLSPSALATVLRLSELYDWSVIHDASVETPAYFYGDVPILAGALSQVNTRELNHSKIGGELVSPVISANGSKWMIDITNLLNQLKLAGEEEETTRDSMHVHINLNKYPPVHVLIKIIKLWMKVEHYIYRLAGFGIANRGLTNNFTFMRPMSSPPYVNVGTMAYPTFVLEELYATKTVEDFLKCFGDVANSSSQRYVPQRYVAVNFQKLYTQGSVEFRIWNKTLSPTNAITAILFCRALVESAFALETKFIDGFTDTPLGTQGNGEDFYNKLQRLFPSLSEESVINLMHLWQKSPEINFEPVPTHTHLSPTKLYYKCANKYAVSSTQVVIPNRVDVHQLERDLANQINQTKINRNIQVMLLIQDRLDEHIAEIKHMNRIEKIEKFPYYENASISLYITPEILVEVVYYNKSSLTIQGRITVNDLATGNTVNITFDSFRIRKLSEGNFINLRTLITQGVTKYVSNNAGR